MNWNRHSSLIGEHAFLGASQYSWLNYDEAKVAEVYRNRLATLRGTELHELAANCIKMKQKLYNNKSTLSMYVNDAISYSMTPEQVLFYSENVFGTADAICFRKNKLRIHDLKTGVTPASTKQLKIYEALFCLEYDIRPTDIEAELRIYQSNDKIIEVPDPTEIIFIMDKIIAFDKIIERIKNEER